MIFWRPLLYRDLGFCLDVIGFLSFLYILKNLGFLVTKPLELLYQRTVKNHLSIKSSEMSNTKIVKTNHLLNLRNNEHEDCKKYLSIRSSEMSNAKL